MAATRALAAADRSQRRQPGVGAHHDHLGHRQREDRVERLLLRDVAGRLEAAVEAVGDAAREHRDEPEDAAEERRLAGAIRSEQRDELARLDAERDVLQHRSPVVAEGDVVERDEHGGPVNRSQPRKSSYEGRVAIVDCIPSEV